MKIRLMAFLITILPFMVWSGCSDGDTPTDVDVIGDQVDPPDTFETEDPGATDENGRPDGDVDDTTDTADPDLELAMQYVAIGKERLEAGESLAALDAFDWALQTVPDLQEAHWGMVLARFQSTVSMFGSLVGLAKYKEDPDAPQPIKSLTWPKHEGTIGVSIDALYKSALEQQERINGLKAATENPIFSLEGGLPLEFSGLPMMRLCCDWDRSDLYGISSWNQLMLAFVTFFGSQNLELSFERVNQLLKTVPGFTNKLGVLLDEYPNIATLLPQHGAELWRYAGTYLAQAADDALQAAALMEDDKNAVATLEETSNVYLVLHGEFSEGRDQLRVIWDSSSVSLKDIATKVKANMAGEPGNRLSLDKEVLPAIVVLLDIANRTFGIQPLLNKLGISLPDAIAGLIGVLDKKDPEQLVELAVSLLPNIGLPEDTIELDLANFFDTPFNIRDLLPVMGPEPSVKTAHKTFLRSFECLKWGLEIAEKPVLWIHDPSSNADELEITIKAFAEGEEEPSGTLDVKLEPFQGFTGLYYGDFEVQTEPAEPGDYIIQPAGGHLTAEYQSAEHTESTISISGAFPDDWLEWDYGASCEKDTKAWDGPHFWEAEFADAVEVTAPGQTVPLEEIAADGKATNAGYLAFPSPSFAGLIWFKDGDQSEPANQASFSKLIVDIMAKIGGLL